jgi:AcrR family transcriptional regulator
MTDTSCATAMSEVRSSPRERILDAATRLFATHGYEHTSTLSIARAAGTSETQLMKNFVNKQGLLEAVFAELLGNMARCLEQVQHLDSPRGKLREFFRRVLPWLEEHPELKKMFFLDLRRIRNKNDGDVLTGPGHDEFLLQIDGILEDARKVGQLKCPLRTQLIRAALFGAMAELLRESIIAQDAAETPATSAEIDAMLDYLFSCFFV